MSECENTQPMGQWVRGGKRKCFMGVILDWYVGELDENGKAEEVAKIRQMVEKGDVSPEEVADELDAIKERADPGLRARLRELDCSLQVNEKSVPTGTCPAGEA